MKKFILGGLSAVLFFTTLLLIQDKDKVFADHCGDWGGPECTGAAQDYKCDTGEATSGCGGGGGGAIPPDADNYNIPSTIDFSETEDDQAKYDAVSVENSEVEIKPNTTQEPKSKSSKSLFEKIVDWINNISS